MAIPLLNKYWTVLSKADIYLWQTAPYVRKTTPQLFREGPDEYKIDALIPFGDNLLRSFQIEELIQLVLMSPFAQRLLDLDPLNSYSKARLEYPVPGVHHSAGLPTGVRLLSSTTDNAFIEYGNGDISFECTVTPGAGTITVDNGPAISFTSGNNLTSAIVIKPGFVIQLQGNIGASPFTFTVNFVSKLSIDWAGILRRVQLTKWEWRDSDLKNTAEEDPVWTRVLAAYVVDAVESNLSTRVPVQ